MIGAAKVIKPKSLRGERQAGRIAIIVGNNNYGPRDQLYKCVADATSMKHVVERLGFDVQLLLDGTLEKIETTIHKICGPRNRYEAILFFFAGHGIKPDFGVPYLVPVGYGAVDSLEDQEAELINVHRLEDHLSRHADAVLMFLDCCRTSYISRRLDGRSTSQSPSMGITRDIQTARVQDQKSGSSIILWASARQQAASEGHGKNSIFTSSLLKRLPAHDVEIRDVMAQVCEDVRHDTQDIQCPSIEGHIRGGFWLDPGPQAVTLRSKYLLSLLERRATLSEILTFLCDDQYKVSHPQAITLLQAKVADSTDINHLQTVLTACNNCATEAGNDAKRLINERLGVRLWPDVAHSRLYEFVEDYISRFPDSANLSKARERAASLRYQQARRDAAGINILLARYSDTRAGRFAALEVKDQSEAQPRRQIVEWACVFGAIIFGSALISSAIGHEFWPVTTLALLIAGGAVVALLSGAGVREPWRLAGYVLLASSSALLAAQLRRTSPVNTQEEYCLYWLWSGALLIVAILRFKQEKSRSAWFWGFQFPAVFVSANGLLDMVFSMLSVKTNYLPGIALAAAVGIYAVFRRKNVV